MMGVSAEPSYEEERLRILDKVVRQEISPRAAGLEMAMLKQRFGRVGATTSDSQQSKPSAPVLPSWSFSTLRAGLGCLSTLSLALLPVTFCLVWLWNELMPVLWPQLPALDYVRTWLFTIFMVGVVPTLLLVIFVVLFLRWLVGTIRR